MVVMVIISLYITSIAIFWLGYAINYIVLKARKYALDIEMAFAGYIDNEYVNISDKLDTEKSNAFMYFMITLIPVINTIVAIGKLRKAMVSVRQSLMLHSDLKLG